MSSKRVSSAVCAALVVAIGLSAMSRDSAATIAGMTAAAQQPYEQGVHAFRANDLQSALGFFTQSFNLQKHSHSAYFLGLTYAGLGNLDGTTKFMTIARGVAPQLDNRLAKGATQVLAWAKNADQGETLQLSAKSDAFVPPTPDEGEFRDQAPPSAPSPPSPPPAPVSIASERLTGTWHSDDGATYYIRQVGDAVYWFGQSQDNGASWSNVFQGHVSGRQIVGTWIDVPPGSSRNTGQLVVNVADGEMRIDKVSSSIPYGASQWNR